MKSINVAQLRAFHTVATEGGFTKAARLLNVTQPTLSQEVKALEEAHGVMLLDRSRRTVTPTEMGEALFAITRRLFAAEREALELLAGARLLEVGRLAVGADGPVHAMPSIAAFTKRHPGPRVTLSTGNTKALLDGLFDTRIDVAVLADAPGDSRLHVLPLRRDPILALVAKGHTLARRRGATLKELAGERLIQRETGSVTRRLVERAFEGVGLAPLDTLEVEGREEVLEAAATGLGVGFVSAAEFNGDPRLAALSITGATIEMDEFVICLRERRRLAVARAFLDVAREATEA